MSNNSEPSLASFGKSFQEKLVQIMLDDLSFSEQICEVIDVSFFELKYLQVFVEILLKYREEYSVFPNRSTLESVLRTNLEKQNPVTQKQVRDFFAKILANTLEDIEDDYVKDKSLDFCKKQKLKEAMIKSVSLMEKSSFDEVSTVINRALKLGLDNDNGYNYMKDFEQRYSLKARNPLSTGWSVMDNLIQGGAGKGELGVVVAPTGCHAKGTKILMYNGEFKNVQDIEVGEHLMGPDSLPRTVLRLHSGTENMMKITPIKGESFIVNENHILALQSGYKKGNFEKHINISVKEYLKLSKYHKSLYKLYRPTRIEFPETKPVAYPYIVGLYLGDGSICGSNACIASNDFEIVNEIKTFIFNMGCEYYEYKSKTGVLDIRVSHGHSNNIWKLFSEIGIINHRSGDKFVPETYKKAAFDERLEILAGLLDTDGSYSIDKGGFDYISKSKQLSEDVKFLCQSVGLAAYVAKCTKRCQTRAVGTYYRVSISGDVDKIPTRVLRKKANPRRQIKSVCRTGFSIESVGIDDYYGFTVDKDNLYVMQDFFVTHNCGKSMALVHLGAEAMKQGKNVVYYTLELSDVVVGRRFDACLTSTSLSSLNYLKEDVLEKINKIPGKLIIKEYPTKSASTETLKGHLKKLEQKGFKPDMILVDYGDLLRPVSNQKEKRTELESIYEEMRGIAGEHNCPLWTASQTNRCFSADTTIYTLEENGSLNLKKVDQLKVGDKVETAYGFKEVIDMNTSYQKTYTITLKNGKKIRVSSKHLFPTIDGLKSLDSGLSTGDRLLTKKC